MWILALRLARLFPVVGNLSAKRVSATLGRHRGLHTVGRAVWGAAGTRNRVPSLHRGDEVQADLLAGANCPTGVIPPIAPRWELLGNLVLAGANRGILRAHPAQLIFVFLVEEWVTPRNADGRVGTRSLPLIWTVRRASESRCGPSVVGPLSQRLRSSRIRRVQDAAAQAQWQGEVHQGHIHLSTIHVLEKDDVSVLAVVQISAKVHHEQQGKDQQENEKYDQEDTQLLHRLEDRLDYHLERLHALDHPEGSEGT
mmetsp:Transcript_73106/g.184219  ORF Transcript_73106/g.184219 Transcript_73106/m.184219 type:complete len:255 (-) Transcript_73106:1279-2043(-)